MEEVMHASLYLKEENQLKHKLRSPPDKYWIDLASRLNLLIVGSAPANKSKNDKPISLPLVYQKYQISLVIITGRRRVEGRAGKRRSLGTRGWPLTLGALGDVDELGGHFGLIRAV